MADMAFMRSSTAPAARARRLRGRRRLQGAMGLCSLTLALVAHGYELEPRSYSNIPVGMNFLVVGGIWQTGDVGTDPSAPLDDAEVDVWKPIVGYARGIDLRGRSGKLDVVMPYSCMEGTAEFLGTPVERDVCGLADPSVKLSVNLIGAPAMGIEDIARYREDLIIGVGLRVTAPLGAYDEDKLLNPGSNRWMFRPEVGISKTVGKWTFESIAQAALHTDNDEFFGDVKREQEPIYSLQGHAVYSFRTGAWLALDATGFRGGRTTVDGRRGDDLQKNSRWGLTLALPVNPHHSIKLAWSSGVVTRAGGDFDTVSLLWQYRWGGGL
jgi:hypothetical protein